jgi:pimeloyl-ACP methyl ester carboxylesterase
MGWGVDRGVGKIIKFFFENRGYHCVTTTLRHHDINPMAHPDSMLGKTSLLDYVNDLEQEILQLNMEPIVMGHSMGGLLAQILGSRDLAKALVLLTPAPPSGIMSLSPGTIKCFWNVLAKWGFWKTANRQIFDEAVYSLLHLMPEDQQKIIFDKFVYESGRAASEIGFWFLDSKRASYVDSIKIKCPVLVISGSEDRITPATIVEKIAKKYEPLSTYRSFENHAHWVIGEPGWQEIADYISEWLDNISR